MQYSLSLNLSFILVVLFSVANISLCFCWKCKSKNDGVTMRIRKSFLLHTTLCVHAVIILSSTVQAAGENERMNDLLPSEQINVTEKKKNIEAGINPGGDFSWEIFLPAFVVKTPPPKWGADSWVCCSISPYTFSLTVDGVTKKATRNTCSDDAGWEGWGETVAGPKDFTWTTSGGCNGFSGSFSETLENGKNYLFKAEWNGTTVIVSTTIVDRKEGPQNRDRETFDLAEYEARTVFHYPSVKTLIGNNEKPSCR